jgi:mutator protein MutT
MSGNPVDWTGVSSVIIDRLTRMSREFKESGREAAVPRPAATVVLIRDDRKVFLIRRLRAMAFGGMWAFPGGSFEPGETPAQAAVRELMEETGVVVDPADLVPWHRWLTPEFETKRFDTWFYLALLPPGQEALLPEAEADEVRWISPEEAAPLHLAGELPMLPPTLITLTELASFGSTAEIMGLRRDVSEPFIPSFD